LRIVSLLPSATETLFALGLGDQVVAVTHECDFPVEARSLPIVTGSTLPLHEQRSGAIEAEVSLAAAEGRSLYEIDTAAIRALQPDLVIAQDVCRVCAVSADEVADGLRGIQMIRQHPHSLEDVLRDIEELAAACGADATSLMTRLRTRIRLAADAARRRPEVRGVFLEWLDPPYRAGHWTPDILELANFVDSFGRPGIPSVASSWADVAMAKPEVLVLAPCGFDRDRAVAEAALVRDQIEATGAMRAVILDGSAYFNRPGPRLVDSLEVLVASLGCGECGSALDLSDYAVCDVCGGQAFCIACASGHLCTDECSDGGCIAGLCVRRVSSGVTAAAFGV
jgi:iron complex transport system substrate-binding protein